MKLNQSNNQNNAVRIIIQTLLVALIILPSSKSFSQDAPKIVLPSKEFHEEAVRLEADRAKHTLKLDGLLKELKSSEKKVIIDLRGEDAYQKEHITDAINIPMEKLTEDYLAKVIPDKNTKIIIYCDNTFFPVRSIAITTYGYPTLRKLGYSNVFDIESLWRGGHGGPPPELEPYFTKESARQMNLNSDSAS